MFQAIDLVVDRVNEGWEVHAPGKHGIIYPTFKEAVEALAELAGAKPGDVTVRRDGSVLVQRADDDTAGEGRRSHRAFRPVL